jgi:hypothetical protein
MNLPLSEKNLRGLGLILSLIVSLVSSECFTKSLYDACPGGAAKWTRGWWPARIISMLAASAVTVLVFEHWRSLVDYWIANDAERRARRLRRLKAVTSLSPRQNRMDVLGMMLALGIGACLGQYFKESLYAACLGSSARWGIERVAVDNDFWPFTVISGFAAAPAAAAFFLAWQRTVVRWMKPKVIGAP